MDIDNIISSLKHYAESCSFKGWDPYDALNSPIVRLLSFNNKYARMAWIQFLRHSPLNIRKTLCIPKEYNPKGLGIFLSGYVKYFKLTNDQKDLDIIKFLIDKLAELQSKNYSGSCWGYNFNWQSKVTFVPKYSPTIVNTAFIGHALLDYYELSKDNKILLMVLSSAKFILKDLNRKREGDLICFSYSPGDNNYVHNANMLGASLLFRLSKLTNDDSLRDYAIASISYSLKYQQSDGSWYYAETKVQKWKDSFHTAFNLIALKYFLNYPETEFVTPCYLNGFEYYAKNFFLNDGVSKYYNNRTLPIDIHSPAVAIELLSSEKKYLDLANKVFTKMINTFWDPQKNYFYFRKLKYFSIKIPYMRWAQAWAFRGLVNYKNNLVSSKDFY